MNNVLVCLRTDYQPRVLSGEGRCSVCQERVWVALSSPKGMRLVCTMCFPKVVKEETELFIAPPTKSQKEDVDGCSG